MRKILAILLYLIAPIVTFGQGFYYQNIITTATGYPIAGAQVYICTSAATGAPCSPTTTVYSDAALSQVASNPVVTDSRGNFGFYAAPGSYSYSVTGTGIQPYGPVPLTLPCVPSGAGCSGGGGSITVQTNGVNNASQTNLNFTNPSSFNGLNFTWLNPSLGNQSFGITGTLNNSGLTNSTMTVNGVPCVLGSSCNSISGQTNGQVSVANGPNTIGSSLPLQGTDTNVLTSGSISGVTGSGLCTDALGGATTTGCSFPGSPGGVPPDDQCNLASVFSNCAGIADNHKGDPIFYAPLGNPYYDARASGYRAVNVTATPAIAGITATCNGTNQIVLSGTPTTPIIVGDGVLVAGCGQNIVVSPPSSVTVTPVTPYAVTNTGMDINLQTGATQYCYTVRTWEPGNNTATNPGTGISAASAEFSTTTGPATLGPQTANPVTAVTCTHETCALTLTNAQSSNTSGHVQLKGFSPNQFNGEWNISTWTDSTHVTISVNFDTDNGGPTTATTLGNFYYVTGVSIRPAAATGSTNGTKYLIYGRNCGGTKNFIGITAPQMSAISADRYYNVFEDYGSTYSPVNQVPLYVPATDAAGALPEGLQTTVTNVAGTTLTLADAAVQSSSGNVFLFDNGAPLRAAATAANARGARLYIPQGQNAAVTNGYFIHNGPVTLPANTEVEYGGGWYLNDTIHLNTSDIINALPVPSGYIQFGIDPAPTLSCIHAFPCLDSIQNNNSNTYWNGPLTFQIPESGIGYYQVQGGIPCGNLRDLMLNFQGNAYTSFGLVFASVHGGACAEFDLGNITVTANQTGSGLMNTPAIYARGSSNFHFHWPYLSGKGLIFNAPAAAGTIINIDVSPYAQALYMPYVSLANQDGGNASAYVSFRGFMSNDTGAAPCWGLYAASAAPGSILLNADLTQAVFNTAGQTFCGYYNGVVKYRQGMQTPPLPAGTLGQETGPYFISSALNTQLGYASPYFRDSAQQTNTNFSSGPAYTISSRNVAPAAPTCTVNAGGSVPIGNVWYLYSIVPPDGKETTPSLVCSATTSSGNQTVNIVVPGAKLPVGFKYNYYRSVTSATAGFTQIVLGVSSSSNVNDTNAGTNGVNLPADQVSGIAGINGLAGAGWAPKGYFGSLSISDMGTCTMTSGTCTSINLSHTYTTGPYCQLTWTGSGTLTGILKSQATTTTIQPASSVGTDTAVVHWSCDGN